MPYFPRALAIRQNTPMGASFRAILMMDITKSAILTNQLRTGVLFSSGSMTMATPIITAMINTCIIFALLNVAKILLENISVKNLPTAGSSAISTASALPSVNWKPTPGWNTPVITSPRTDAATVVNI